MTQIGALVNDEVAWLGKKMQELLDAYTQQNNSERQPKTFEEVEKIWTEQVTPALNTFKTVQNTGDPPPEDSQWFRQWKLPELS